VLGASDDCQWCRCRPEDGVVVDGLAGGDGLTDWPGAGGVVVTAAGALPFGLGETSGGVVEPAGAFGGLPLFWFGPAGGPALGGAAGGSVAFGFRD
jgi:hypothetical protein